MQKYFSNVANRKGVAVAGALIAVTTLSGSSAALFLDNGVTPRTTALLTDANGYFEFYAPDGRYTVRVTGDGITPLMLTDILLEDPVDNAMTNIITAPLNQSPNANFNFAIENVGAVERLGLPALANLLTPYFAPGPVGPNIFDSATLAEYTAAIANAANGSKRMAGASAIVAALNPVHRLVISRDGVSIAVVNYSGACVATNDGTNVVITLGSASGGSVATADIDTGTWTFQLQGGANFARSLSGTVGPAGSGADLILSADTDGSSSFTSTISFIVPRSIDGL